PAGRTGYLANASGGIDVVDLEKGKLLWSSTEATRPLGLLGNRLVALAQGMDQGSTLRVVVLDTRGKRLLRSAPVPVPDRTSARGRRIVLSPSQALLDRGSLWLRWMTFGRPGAIDGGRWRGRIDAPDLPRRPAGTSTVARVDLRTGKVASLGAAK